MNPTIYLGIFVPLFLTVLLAAGGVFVFRGSYYKSLPGRVRELEQDVERKDAALKRQDRELQFVKGIANQTPEILKLIELFGTHTRVADERFDKMETMFMSLDKRLTSNHNLINKMLNTIEEDMKKRGNV